jgi:hypothetical protein
MMDEREMDAYISRCMKNWAACQPLPAGGRERLIRAASLRPDIYRTRLGSPFSNVLKAVFSSQPVGMFAAIETEADWLFVPFTQSHLWSFHLATSSKITI